MELVELIVPLLELSQMERLLHQLSRYVIDIRVLEAVVPEPEAVTVPESVGGFFSTQDFSSGSEGFLSSDEGENDLNGVD